MYERFILSAYCIFYLEKWITKKYKLLIIELIKIFLDLGEDKSIVHNVPRASLFLL